MVTLERCKIAKINYSATRPLCAAENVFRIDVVAN